MRICGCVCLLAVAASAIWCAASLDRLSRAAEGQIASVGGQAKLAVMSWRGVSFDLRKNWTANTDLQAAIQARMAATLDRAGAALERSAMAADRVADSAACLLDTSARAVAAVERDVPEALASTLGEAKIALRGAQRDLAAMSSAVAAATAQAGDGVASVACEAAGLLREGRTVVEDAARVSESAARLAEHYERQITRPSRTDRLRWILNTALFGLGEIIVPVFVRQKVSVAR